MSTFELPFGTQFSPNQIDIIELLLSVEKCDGQATDTLIKILEEDFFAENAESSRKAMANNCKNSLVAYGIIKTGGGINLSTFGKSLLNISEEDVAVMIAKHIIIDLNGYLLIDAVRILTRSGKSPTNESVIETLNQMGCTLSKSSNNAQVMKLWLEKAGVLNGWSIIETKLQEIIGYTEKELSLFKELRPEQFYFLRSLCNTGNDEYQKAADVRKLTIATYGITFAEKSFSTQILNPLEEKGLIEKLKTSEGRGGNTPLVKVTELTKTEIILPLLNQLEKLIGKDVLMYYQKPLTELRKDIDSEDNYIKGIALEAFAIKVMGIIGLDFVKTRLKGNETGGAEVDVLFDSSRLLYSRWQVQCKNTKTVSLDQVAKEVGLSHVLKTNAIVILTTGKISGKAKEYANKIMGSMNLCIILIEENDVNEILKDPINIIGILNRESLNAKSIKVLDV